MRHEFEVDSSFINLNSGTQSLCPRSTLEMVTRLQREYETNPSLNMTRCWQDMWKINETMGRFFKGEPQCFFLRSNVTQALNTMIFGFPLKAGDEIAVSNLEYGAIANICRLRAEREQLHIRRLMVPVRGPHDDDAPSDEEVAKSIVSQLSPATKMLVLSHILTGTGQIMPLKAIAAETRRRGVLFVVDGAQAPGSIAVDFSELKDVDAYGGNLHKWMMGPKGTAFGWVPVRHHETLQTMGGGWNSFENFTPGGNYGEGNRFFHKFLPQGCQDFSRYLALQDTFDFQQRQSQQKIFQRLNKLQKLALSQGRAVLKFSPISPEIKDCGSAPLIAFELPEKYRQLPAAVLRKQIFDELKVLVATPYIDGRNVLRLSPHIYNTEDEVAEGVRRLGTFFK